MRYLASVLGPLLLTAACKSDTAPTPTSAPAPSASASAAAGSAASAPTARHSGPVKPHPSAAPMVVMSTTVVAEDGKDPTLSPTSAGIPTVDFGAAGPLTIKGYGTPLEFGMKDFATRVGYSKDGTKAIACGIASANGERCVVNEKGVTKDAATTTAGKELAEGETKTLAKDSSKNVLVPPPVLGTWPYASDIALEITEESSESGSGTLRLGGSYAKEEPVFSIALSVKTQDGGMPYSPSWNAIVLNPAKDELALIGHFFCMEWCNEFVVSRVGLGAIASLVYNDTGYRHHQKKEYTASRDLFLKATWANPKAPLPPYNLSCAYALLNDEKNAEKALKLAIAVAGDKVRARAKKDTDFKAFVNAPWFKALTAG